MRQIISTALVALVVSLVTVTAVGALAQDVPAPATEQAIVPSVTSLNAHKVDGRHAVSARASRARRAGKLVATNKQGYLPANIIKPAWKLISGKPAGFADGVDNQGITGLKVTQQISSGLTLAPDRSNSVFSPECPAGSYLVGGGHWASTNSVTNSISAPWAATQWIAALQNHGTSSATIWAYALCLSTEPAGAITTSSKGIKPAGLKKRK
jgi:hypothetical protein